jgi:hypothetical protein
MATITPTFVSADTVAAVLSQLENAARSSDNVVRGALIALDDPSQDIAAILERRCNSSVRVLWSSRVAQYIHVQVTRRRRAEKRTISGTILVLPTDYDRVYIIFTLGSSEFVKEVLVPLLDQCNPRLFLPYVTSKSLEKVVLTASKHEDILDFEVSDVGARSRIENKKSRRIRSERIWTEEPVENVLSILRDRGQWLQSLSFHCKIKNGDDAIFCTGNMSRRCIFRVQGDFQWFKKRIIDPTISEAVQTMKFYLNRARQETPNNEPRPIVIEYAEAIFRDKSQNRRLVHSLNRLSKANVSVIHANPYFHASVVDFTDGSSYEVWVLSENRIIVTPQFRATVSSIGRVCDHILSSFEEGDVKDFQEVICAE